jgi:hypothetical protein
VRAWRPGREWPPHLGVPVFSGGGGGGGLEWKEQSRDVSGKETTERERESAIRAEQRSAHAHLDKDLHGPGRHVLY